LYVLLFIFERRFEQFDNEFPRTRASAMCDWLKRIMGYAQSSHSDHKNGVPIRVCRFFRRWVRFDCLFALAKMTCT